MASYVPSFITGALGEATEAIHGYKAMKREAWGSKISKELEDLRVDEKYIENASKNLEFVKQQKEFSDENSILMLDYMFKKSPALFSSKEPLLTVKRAKNAFDAFPGIVTNDDGTYSIDFDVDALVDKEIHGFVRGNLSTGEESVEAFKNKNRIDSKNHLITTGLPKNLTNLFLGETELEKQKDKFEPPENYLTVSGYLGEIGAEWKYNTYLPESIKWEPQEYFNSKYLEMIQIMNKVQEKNPNVAISSPQDVIEVTQDPAFWTKKGFDDVTMNRIQVEFGKVDMKAVSTVYESFVNQFFTLVEDVKTGNINYGNAQDALELAISQHGINSKQAQEALVNLAQTRVDLKRANSTMTSTWENYYKTTMGLSTVPFSGFSGTIGIENMRANFAHATSSLKLHGVEVNVNDLIKIFTTDEGKDKVRVMPYKGGEMKFITYKSQTEPGYTFIVMENGVAIKVADDKLQ